MNYPVLLIFLATIAFSGCASSPEVKSQQYAALPDRRVFEHEFPTVWKGIETTLKSHKIVSRDPDEVSAEEMRKLTERELETDWFYSQSRDKYQEYTVNSLPKKKYLQTRLKYLITAKSVMGGTDVRVEAKEEIETLKKDGSSAGYQKSETPDPSRAAEILEKINLAILASP